MSVYVYDEWLGAQNPYQRAALQDKIMCRTCARLKQLSDCVRG